MLVNADRRYLPCCPRETWGDLQRGGDGRWILVAVSKGNVERERIVSSGHVDVNVQDNARGGRICGVWGKHPHPRYMNWACSTRRRGLWPANGIRTGRSARIARSRTSSPISGHPAIGQPPAITARSARHPTCLSVNMWMSDGL